MKIKVDVLRFAVPLLVIVLVASLPTVAWGDAKPLGFWTYVQHEADIPGYHKLEHWHYVPVAIHGYAQLVSSTGPVDFYYHWDDAGKFLYVCIWNWNNYQVHVVWRCWFYIV